MPGMGDIVAGPSMSMQSFAPTHERDVRALQIQADVMVGMIRSGLITKTQAAQYLNKFRLELVGPNPVDDEAYEVYLTNTVRSQNGQITSQESKQNIQSALNRITQKWYATMGPKPTNNPAFTDFLLHSVGMPPLRP